MTAALSPSEKLKLGVLSEGVEILPDALTYITERNGDRPLSPADYASTSGIILELADGVWVNAPIATYNPNFVEKPQFVLDFYEDGLVVRGNGWESSAKFWLPPKYHDECNEHGIPYTSYAFTHADRVRISPIEGCALTCKFCDLPYEFRYRKKDVAGLVDAVRRALNDEIQPAGHVLISGGTPRPDDYEYLQECYEQVIRTFPSVPVDIMMVPMKGLLDVQHLHDIGVNELSINLEIFNREIARKVMRRKFDQGLSHYLDFLETSAAILGRGKVRSMLMVGLEPMEDTLAGVEAIALRGCVPVLSPFRPDASTPMRDVKPPTSAYLEEVYLRAHEITQRLGAPLGPRCIPCGHNTLTFARECSGDAHQYYGHPHLI